MKKLVNTDLHLDEELIEDYILEKSAIVRDKFSIRQSSEILADFCEFINFPTEINKYRAKKVSGVYLLNGCYVGRSHDIKNRTIAHIKSIVRGDHINRLLSCNVLKSICKEGKFTVEFMSPNQQDEGKIMLMASMSGSRLYNNAYDGSFVEVKSFIDKYCVVDAESVERDLRMLSKC